MMMPLPPHTTETIAVPKDSPSYHPPVKRSVEIAGHKTSISLEPVFWEMLRAAALREGVPLNALVARIDSERISSPTPPGLAGAIRLWLVHAAGVAAAWSHDADGCGAP
ncbi:Ribbon-helix-helix domain-containing protein [Novosphingobium lubricantis]|jgi:predicted DNA-binding ribbon-helix-helix protein